MSGLDSSKQYGERSDHEWEEYSLNILRLLSEVPAEYMHQGPTFFVVTKDGRRITCETCYYNFKHRRSPLDCVAVESGGVGMKHVLIAKTDDGEIVGMRCSTIFDVKGPYNRFDVRSKIIVKYRGCGLASAVESAFSQALQWFADIFSQDVVEYASNENLRNLTDFRDGVSDGVEDPSLIPYLEQEQERWQALYGDGGGLGFQKGKRVFRPKGRE